MTTLPASPFYSKHNRLEKNCWVCILQKVVESVLVISFTEPPYLTAEAQVNTSIIENNRVILPCPARGTPAPKISWFKNGNPLTGNEIGERILPDGSLQLEHAHYNNTGRYTCIAESVAGNVAHSIELTVYGQYCMSLFIISVPIHRSPSE